MRSDALAERIGRFVQRPDEGGFDDLAATLARELNQRSPAFRELCTRLGDGQPTDWQAIPPAPESSAPASDDDDLARAAADRAFMAGCVESPTPMPVLALIPDGAPELTEAGARILERFGGPGSTSAVAGERVKVAAARSWIAARQRDRRAPIVLATRDSLERLFTTLERQDLRFQLPLGSRLVVMDALASRSGVDQPRDPVAFCAVHLGLPPESVLGRHRWRAIPTPLYGRLTTTGGLAGAVPSPWTRIRAFDAGSLDERPEGAKGRLAVLDLTITDRPFHLLTATTGTVTDGIVDVDPS